MDINATIASSQGGGGDAQNEVKSTQYRSQLYENASSRSELQQQAQSECVLNEHDVALSSKLRHYVQSSR